MGENLFHQPLADPQRGSLAPYAQPSLRPNIAFDPPDAANGDEEPYTIRCICNYADDDGNTVLCEDCNTWQHISCYYYPKDRLDADDDHVCAVCKPHLHRLDAAAANQRQQAHRGPAVSEDRKPRRSAPKSHRKTKTKDSIVVNGWSAQDGPNNYSDPQHNHRGASPRDQYGPPAKRPKTSHRHSGSLASNAVGRLSRGPTNVKSMPPLSELPSDYFSPIFLRVHRENGDCKPATANLHLTIDIANSLSTWLDDPSTFEAVTNGKKHNDILQRVDGTIEELPTVPIEKRVKEEPDVLFHGNSPIWPYLTVERDVAFGELVGELRGGVGHQVEYKTDPSNHWSKLRHPDHFVFFHPSLPIYIDCRSEGTLLRYVRRSCRPNLKMTTLITGGREYHFCFTALRDIPAGAEITVNWDPDPELKWDFKDGDMTEAVREQLCGRAEELLSHFGGCACGTEDCLMLHFDRRIPFVQVDSNHDADQRTVKNGKKRKASKRSPPDLGNIDASRASSEAVTHGDIDEDMDDARSISHSAGSKPSRDNTPSGQNGTSEKLSERERRKLLQQERLFEQMEHNQQQGTRKKKRVSGSNPPGAGDPTTARPSQKRAYQSGSNPNTPIHTSRPSPRSPDEPSPHSTVRPHSALSPHHIPVAPPPTPPQRQYVDSGTQLDFLPEAASPRNLSTSSTRSPRSCLSLSKRLLRQSLVSRAQRSSSEVKPSPVKIANGIAGAGRSAVSNSGEAPHDISATDADEDHVMTDAATSTSATEQGAEGVLEGRGVKSAKTPPPPPPAPAEPPAPPWQPPSGAPSSEATSGPQDKVRPSYGLHVDLPPPPTVMAKLGKGEETAVASPDAQPSASTGPPPTPSLPTAPVVASETSPPTPAPRKKMSLSAYFSKRKAEQAVDAATSPLEQKSPLGMPSVDTDKVKQEENNGDVAMSPAS